MRSIIIVVDDRAHGICRAYVPNVSLLLIQIVDTNHCSSQDGIVEVCTERAVAHVHEHVRAVIVHPDVDRFRDTGRACLQRERGCCLRERLIAAGSWIGSEAV